MNPEQRGDQLTPKRTPKLRRAALALALVLAVAIAVFTLLNATCYRQYTLTGPYARQYEGKILDKSQTITESQTGSGVRRRLLIEGRGGERFQVAVGEETYERARKGMWIKKSEEAGVELTWPTEATPSESPAPEPRR